MYWRGVTAQNPPTEEVLTFIETFNIFGIQVGRARVCPVIAGKTEVNDAEDIIATTGSS